MVAELVDGWSSERMVCMPVKIKVGRETDNSSARTGVAEVGRLQLILFHFEASLDDLERFGAAYSDVGSDLLVTADAEAAHRVSCWPKRHTHTHTHTHMRRENEGNTIQTTEDVACLFTHTHTHTHTHTNIQYKVDMLYI